MMYRSWRSPLLLHLTGGSEFSHYEGGTGGVEISITTLFHKTILANKNPIAMKPIARRKQVDFAKKKAGQQSIKC